MATTKKEMVAAAQASLSAAQATLEKANLAAEKSSGCNLELWNEAYEAFEKAQVALKLANNLPDYNVFQGNTIIGGNF